MSGQYFESDDKDFFRSKIKYIQENDPEDLGVVFAEEEYNSEGHIEQVLCPATLPCQPCKVFEDI